MSHPDLIIHDEKDNVGVVVIETTKKGQDCNAWIMENDKTVKVPSNNEVPLGHKIALNICLMVINICYMILNRC